MLVTIDTTTTAISRLAEQIRASQAAVIQWDEENWHYQLRSCGASFESSSCLPYQQERVAAYILALDAINFCFWPVPGYEYKDLAMTLTQAAHADHPQQEAAIRKGKSTVSDDFVFSATNLETMTVDSMTELFVKHHASGLVPPDMDKRCGLWNEVGRVLVDKFNGSVRALIESARGSAPTLVQLLVDNFLGFRDHNVRSGLYFYKRAQICVGDWNAALKLNLQNMDQLTTFADYRVPQLLRHWNVLVYSKQLAATVDAQIELAMDSAEEHAIRATTVAAVELLVLELGKGTSAKDNNNSWNAVTTDWYLWQVGERMQTAGQLQPHHRVRTIFY